MKLKLKWDFPFRWHISERIVMAVINIPTLSLWLWVFCGMTRHNTSKSQLKGFTRKVGWNYGILLCLLFFIEFYLDPRSGSGIWLWGMMMLMMRMMWCDPFKDAVYCLSSCWYDDFEDDELYTPFAYSEPLNYCLKWRNISNDFYSHKATWNK